MVDFQVVEENILVVDRIRNWPALLNCTFHCLCCLNLPPFNFWMDRMSESSSLLLFTFKDGFHGNSSSEQCVGVYLYRGCLYGEICTVLHFKIGLMTIIHISASIWTYSLSTLNWFSFLDVLKPIHVSWLKYYVKNVFVYKDMANILNTVKKYFLQILLEDWLQNFLAQQKDVYGKVRILLR